MTESTAAIGTSVSLSATDAPAGAAVPPSGKSSVDLRVAAIRTKAAQLSADAAVPSTDRPARVAWNDWKNE
jgi:hypothetical protein